MRIKFSSGMNASGACGIAVVLRGTAGPPAVRVEQPDRDLRLARAGATYAVNRSLLFAPTSTGMRYATGVPSSSATRPP